MAIGIVGSNNGYSRTASDNRFLKLTGGTVNGTLAINSGSISTSQPLTLTQTWNASGVTFAAQVVDITTTSSANGSAFFDVKQNGLSRFKVVKSSSPTTAQIIINGGDANPCSFTCGGNLLSIANEGNQNVTFNGFTVTRNANGSAGLGGTITSTQTWNSSASIFTGFNMNVTDTNSDPASLLMNLQVGGTSKFKVAKSGLITTTFGLMSDGILYLGSYNNQYAAGLYSGGDLRATIIRAGLSNNSPSFTADADNILAQRHGLNAQESRIYSTYTNASNYERFFIKTNVGATSATQIGLSAAGSGVNRNLEFVVGGSTIMTIASGGNVGVGNTAPVCKLDIAETWNSGILITGASGTGTAATITFTALATAIPVGTSIIVAGINPTGYNGTFTVTASTTSSVTYANATTATYVSGGAINHPITGASGTGTVATVTFRAMPAAIPVGSTVVVASINPSGYNGTFIVTASTTTSVSYANATSATYIGGGNIQQLYTGVRLNVTDTASNAASQLMDLQVDGVSRFRVEKAGGIKIGDGTVTAGSDQKYISFNTAWGEVNFKLWGGDLSITGAGLTFFSVNSPAFFTTHIGLGGNKDTADVKLWKDAANTLAQRNGLNAQTSRLYNTYTSATNFERLNFRWSGNTAFIGTEKGSGGGTARDLVLETDGTERVRINTAGNLTASGTITASGTVIFGAGAAILNSPSAGIFTITNAAGMDSGGFVSDQLRLRLLHLGQLGRRLMWSLAMKAHLQICK